jgi:hypothetical protein
MGQNFDDYPGFQPKATPAQRYATQCTCYNYKQVPNMTEYFGPANNVKLTGNEPFCMLHMAQHNFDSKLLFLNFLPSLFESQQSQKL